MSWPLLEERPECVKDTEHPRLARSWTANLSDEVLNYTVLSRKALQETVHSVTHSQTEYEGFWILCDEKGTWVVITYPTPKEPQVAIRNFRQLFKPWGKDVIMHLEKTKRFFNESHQARIQKFKVRKELIYQCEVEKATKPKVCKENLGAYSAARELALATPMPRSVEGMPSVPYQGTVALLMDEAEQINLDVQELTEAQDQCKAERDALNEQGGDAESREHLDYEAKYLKVLSYDQLIKQKQAESESVYAKMTSEKERIKDLVEACDNEHGALYALWPLGDCGYHLPQAQIFIKSMREEKDREQFLQGELQDQFPPTTQIPPPEGSIEKSVDKRALIKKSMEVVRATVKKTKELQDDDVLPTDKNSMDRGRTRKRVANVCKAMTGEVPDLKDINKLLDKEDGCHQCGSKGVSVYCEEGGGPILLLETVWEEDPSPVKGRGPRFCSEECCLRYRIQPVCDICGNSDKKQMFDSCAEAPAEFYV